MQQQIDPQEIDDTTQKIRSGEYFREAEQVVDFSMHDPMAERYFYIFITAVAIIIVFIALGAVGSLYPLRTRVPVVFESANIEEDLPKIRPLKLNRDEDANVALRRFLMNNYVQLREQYDIAAIERNASGIQSQSTPEVFSEYQRTMDPRNPQSPIAMYQRDLKRQIKPVSQRSIDAHTMEVIFDAILTGAGERKQSRWVATIAFEYEDVKVDDEAHITPFQFVVTRYSSHPIQE